MNEIKEDRLQRRCPKLGHQIDFGYCRRENKGNPCGKALDCWFEIFDVVGFFRPRLTEAQWRQYFAGAAPPKVLSLLDLIEQAKARQKDAK